MARVHGLRTFTLRSRAYPKKWCPQCWDHPWWPMVTRSHCIKMELGIWQPWLCHDQKQFINKRAYDIVIYSHKWGLKNVSWLSGIKEHPHVLYRLFVIKFVVRLDHRQTVWGAFTTSTFHGQETFPHEKPKTHWESPPRHFWDRRSGDSNQRRNWWTFRPRLSSRFRYVKSQGYTGLDPTKFVARAQNWMIRLCNWC